MRILVPGAIRGLENVEESMNPEIPDLLPALISVSIVARGRNLPTALRRDPPVNGLGRNESKPSEIYFSFSPLTAFAVTTIIGVRSQRELSLI